MPFLLGFVYVSLGLFAYMLAGALLIAAWARIAPDGVVGEVVIGNSLGYKDDRGDTMLFVVAWPILAVVALILVFYYIIRPAVDYILNWSVS